MSSGSKRFAIIGAGAIGKGLIQGLSLRFPEAEILVVSRADPQSELAQVSHIPIQYDDEDSILHCAQSASGLGPLDWVMVTCGILHEDGLMPEKSLRDLSAYKFRRLFEINTIVPALLAKHFLPKLNTQTTSIFAALSARVGSISDNHLGGWYAYRASKVALNMIIKNAAIEMKRRNEKAIVVGLHPGTVDSALSKPFQGNVPQGKLLSAEYSAQNLIRVLQGLTAKDSGHCFAWDGKEISP